MQYGLNNHDILITISNISEKQPKKAKYVIKVMLGYLDCQKLILFITCLNNHFLKNKWYGGICYSKLHMFWKYERVLIKNKKIIYLEKTDFGHFWFQTNGARGFWART